MKNMFDILGTNEPLSEYQLKAREITDLGERIKYLNKQKDRQVMFEKMGGMAAVDIFFNIDKGKKTALDTIIDEINRTMDLIQLGDIEAKAADMEKINALHYLIECKQAFKNSPEFVDMAGLNLSQLKYFTPQQFENKINTIMDKIRAEKQKAEFEKIKWNGSKGYRITKTM